LNLCLLDLEILKVQNTVEKTVGSPVMMECYYKPQYVEYEKYWCKLEMNGKCQSVNSNRDEQKRWEINDKTNNYTLTLYTRTLTMEDAGQYQCGIRRSEYPIDTVQVQLRVLPVAKCHLIHSPSNTQTLFIWSLKSNSLPQFLVIYSMCLWFSVLFEISVYLIFIFCFKIKICEFFILMAI
uniref:Ig-like domain-containing protein n=1 Tax=Erpetoichthys calabaricus TaxID=27687 RepID=A0A8C4RVT4_ERPCA